MKIVNKFLTYSESYYKNNKSGVYAAFVLCEFSGIS